MSPLPCLEEETLARLASGALDEAERKQAELHLSGCAACLRLASWIWKEEGGGFRALPPPRLRWMRFAAAAAGLLLLAAGAVGLLPMLRAKPEPFSVPVETGVSGRREHRLPDGSRVVLHEKTRVRFLRPEEGERARIELSEGTLEADVARGSGAFRVLSPAGEIRVLGTRFRANVFRVRHPAGVEASPGSSGPLPCLAVHVQEGAVMLAGPRGEVRVPAGSRGVTLAGRPPALMQGGGGRRDILVQFAPLVLQAGENWGIRPGLEPEAEFLSALYWSGEWQGDAAPQTPQEQAALEILEGLKE